MTLTFYDDERYNRQLEQPKVTINLFIISSLVNDKRSRNQTLKVSGTNS